MTRRLSFIPILLLLFLSACAVRRVSIVSWNLDDFGRTVSQEEMSFIAKTVKPFDVLAIQEVVGKNGGVDAVHRLLRKLNKDTIGKWKANISPITTGSPYESERYAFIWNSKKVAWTKKAWLAENLEKEITREPFLSTFVRRKDTFTLVTFHAVPKGKEPEKELRYFYFFLKRYPKKRLLFMGDFNTPASNPVFDTLKSLGYLPALFQQKTSLKMKCIEKDCLASEYDHIFYNQKEIKKIKADILPFYKKFPDLKTARKISDHVPIFLVFKAIRD